ncbi:hypothetical protein F2P79_025600, partial [Pimephales promelas]
CSEKGPETTGRQPPSPEETQHASSAVPIERIDTMETELQEHHLSDAHAFDTR